jgi:hypothetical protein
LGARNVISVKTKSMSITLFKIVTLAHCLPEGFQHNYFHILPCCWKLLPQTLQFITSLYSCAKCYLPLLFTVFDITSSSSHTQQQVAGLYFSLVVYCKLFLHCSPTVAGMSQVQMKRTGKSSAYSSSLSVQELVIIQVASTQSIIQLPDFYCLVINYNYVLVYNKQCNQYGLSLLLFKYTLQAICTISTDPERAKFTTVR